jgi:ABC-type transporter Mla maintaining outer membrane lipid asymmetry permease subunit MlaE
MQPSYPLVAVSSFCAGAVLFYLAANYLGGFLAAVAIPSAYFQWFGRENVNLALALMFAATWSLPVAAAVAAGVVPSFLSQAIYGA